MQGESHGGSVRVAHLSRKGIIQPMQPLSIGHSGEVRTLNLSSLRGT